MEPEGIALRMTAYPRENSGELAAFERIMSQCERRVLRVALRLLNNPQDAQDAAQEVFLRLYKHLGDLDETRGYETTSRCDCCEGPVDTVTLWLPSSSGKCSV